jgi:hypothetical protein
MIAGVCGLTVKAMPTRRRRNIHGAPIAIPVACALAIGAAVAVVAVAGAGHGAPRIRPAAAASTVPIDAAVSAAGTSTDCDLIVPADPLSARGLATPYVLTGPAGTSAAASGCQMINSVNLGACVQATILNPRTGALSVYNPLVITQGTAPAIAPVVPKLPADAIVTIDMGFNGTYLYQVGATPNALRQGRCTDGEPGSPFGQVSFCNGTAFFDAAFAMERTGGLVVPPAGTSRVLVPGAAGLGTGRQCPTTRNYDMVDQDPSDNVTTKYLLNPVTGQTAQNSMANTARMPGAQVLVNGSDNALIDNFLDPALGCHPFTAPDLGDHDAMTTSQALDELLAARNQPASAALVPETDEMVTGVGGSIDPAKTDLYRAEIGEAPVNARTDMSSSPQMFCQDLVDIQAPFLAANQRTFAAWPSPVPTEGDTLYTFMAARLGQSFENLSCNGFGLTNPVSGVVIEGDGAATSVNLNDAQQTAGF